MRLHDLFLKLFMPETFHALEECPKIRDEASGAWRKVNELRSENTELRQRLARQQRPLPRFTRHPAWTDDQIGEVLAGTATLPTVQAIIELIDVRFQDESDAAADPSLSDPVTKYHLGAANAMLTLKADLQARTDADKKGVSGQS